MRMALVCNCSFSLCVGNANIEQALQLSSRYASCAHTLSARSAIGCMSYLLPSTSRSPLSSSA